MTTQYTLTDELPKDAGGAKLIAPINDQTSMLDFGLLRGIGAKSLGATSKNVVYLGVGTHTVGSTLGASHVGLLTMGLYTEAPSTIAPGGAQAIRVDREGAVYVRPASTLLSYSSASVETHILGSAILHDVHIRFDDVDAGDTVEIEDGDAHKFMFVATAASQHLSEHFSAGPYFATSLKHVLTFSGLGAASVTLAYST